MIIWMSDYFPHFLNVVVINTCLVLACRADQFLSIGNFEMDYFYILTENLFLTYSDVATCSELNILCVLSTNSWQTYFVTCSLLVQNLTRASCHQQTLTTYKFDENIVYRNQHGGIFCDQACIFEKGILMQKKKKWVTTVDKSFNYSGLSSFIQKPGSN